VNSKSPDAAYYDFVGGDSIIIGNIRFIHTIFFCPKCKREIEPVTQFSYEDNEKWTRMAYKKLLKCLMPDQICKNWIDNKNNVLYSAPIIEEIQTISFLVRVAGEEFTIPCSVSTKTKCWERPVRIIKDLRFKKAYANLKETMSDNSL
jgi:hypothetical protein